MIEVFINGEVYLVATKAQAILAAVLLGVIGFGLGFRFALAWLELKVTQGRFHFGAEKKDEEDEEITFT